MTTTLDASYIISPATVAQGGTGVTSNTAYGLLAAGTTTTGAIQQAGTGTSNQIYVSGGSSSLGTWTAQDAVGTWQLISTQSASSSASIAFTGLSTSYMAYKFILSNVVPSTAGDHLTPQFSTNNGVSYLTTTGNYYYAIQYQSSSSAFSVFNSNNLITIDAQGLATSNANMFEITFLNPNVSTVNPCLFWMGNYYDNTQTAQVMVWGEGQYNATETVNAIRFLTQSSGTPHNITSGTFNMYGILT